MTTPTPSEARRATFAVRATLPVAITVEQPQLDAAIRRHLSFIVDKAIKLFTDDADLTADTVRFSVDGEVRNGVIADITYNTYGHVNRISLFGHDRELGFSAHTSAGYVIVIESSGVNDMLTPRQVAYVVTFDGPRPVFVNL